ncbi:MAG: protocatechuate 3,4-dioxygenase subunit beta [Rhodospirillales bacterium]|nr:protocatechuate 3,4-dioxygenase subunit beta [Rhodospirillales bacterium]
MAESRSGRRWSDSPSTIFPDYKSSIQRGPGKAPISVPGWDRSLSLRPVWPQLPEGDADLTANGRVNGDPIGERILLEGGLTDEAGRPVPGALVEIWQANAAGRYIHREERHPAPLDPNFLGAGRAVSDAGGSYRFVTVKPGSYPWNNHRNAWRPAHIHFSIFGAGIAQRLITQMYFPGDPTLPYDPIFNATADAAVRNRLIARFSMEESVPNWAHCYRFDIVLSGSAATPFEEEQDHD